VHNAKAEFFGRCCPLLLLCAGFVQSAQLAQNAQAQEPELRVAQSPAAKTDFVTGRQFRDALEQEITIGWQEERLRSGLAQLTAARKIAFVLDRRIDPDQLVTLQIRKASMLDMLRALAESTGGQLSVLENFIYIGPESVARRLRTLVDIRSSELLDAGPRTTKRSFGLFKRQAMEWSNFDEPNEILSKAAKQFDVKLTDQGRLPHDLWAATVLPESTAIEILSVVLAQFDLTFEWESDADAIRIVAMPADPQLKRIWDVKTRTIRELAQTIARRFPSITTELKGTQLMAQGTSEELEKINAALYPKRLRPPKRTRGPKTLSFTFHLRGTIGALMPGLEKQSDLKFEYDAKALAAAGIDLNHKVDVKMQNADTEELCHALFDGAKLGFKIDGTTIKVFAKSDEK
jgi:hypothetical protein